TGTLCDVPEAAKDKIAKLAPSVGISVYDRQLPGPLQRMWELAESLGGDMKAAKATDAKKRFEAASERLRKAVKANPGIKVMAGSASQEIFYVSGTNLSIDLEYFKALGVDFVEPPEKAKADGGGWLESLRWENVDKHPADLIMMDRPASDIQPADTRDGTWNQPPAGRAGQGIARSSERILPYYQGVPAVDRHGEAIEKAKQVSCPGV